MTKDDKQLHLAIDACRPQSSDADGLELDESGQELLRRSEQFDRLVREVLSDGDVPSDLEARLMDRISAEPADGVEREQTDDFVKAAVLAKGPSADAEATVVLAAGSGQDRGPRKGHRFSRRLLAATISLGLAVIVTLTLVWQGDDQGGSPLPARELADRAGRWLPRLEKQVAMPGSWSTAIDQVPAEYEMDRHIIPEARQWQAFSTRLDSGAVMLDLSSRRHGTAYLVVIKTSRQYSLPPYPLQKLASTGQWSLAAWQTGDSLFVLVGGRDVQSLDRLVRSPDFG